jgi:hypothetical protein
MHAGFDRDELSHEAGVGRHTLRVCIQREPGMEVAA